MRDVSQNDMNVSPSLDISRNDHVKVSICPVHPVGVVINGETIGPEDMGFDEPLWIGAVHTQPTNEWCIHGPISPIEVTKTRVYSNSSWVVSSEIASIHAIHEQDTAICSIKFTDTDPM